MRLQAHNAHTTSVPRGVEAHKDPTSSPQNVWRLDLTSSPRNVWPRTTSRRATGVSPILRHSRHASRPSKRRGWLETFARVEIRLLTAYSLGLGVAKSGGGGEDSGAAAEGGQPRTETALSSDDAPPAPRAAAAPTSWRAVVRHGGEPLQAVGGISIRRMPREKPRKVTADSGSCRVRGASGISVFQAS